MKPYHLISTVFLLSILTVACGKPGESAQAKKVPPPMPVQWQTLKTSTLQDSSEYVGMLEAEQTVALKPQIDGRIQQILVKPGDRVTQGEPIFILNPGQTVPLLRSAQASLKSAIAARKTATQQLRVSQSQLASAQSQNELARTNNQRYQDLVRQGAVAQITADQYATALRVQVDAVKQAKNQVNASQAVVNQAEANVQKAQADINNAQVSVNYKRVIAPISGSVGNITLKIGDYVTIGQSLTMINQNSVFDLQVPISVSHSKQLHPGLAVQLLEPNSNQLLDSGALHFVASHTNPSSQTILTRARFSNANGMLRDAQYVKARIIWQTKPGVLIPVDAVTSIGGQNFVFVAENSAANGTQQVAHELPVTLGPIQGQNYQVLQGLKSGDKVIDVGITKLKDGAVIVNQ